MTALRTRRLAPLRRRFIAGRQGRGSEHGVVVLVRSLLLFESVMYSAVTPVLPHYAHTLHASKPAVGLLAAAYPAGIIPGSLIGAWLVTRGGVRRTVLIGLLVFAVSIAAFGFGTAIVGLDVLRFIQGIACGLIWGGGLTWVIAIAPRERRGEVLGNVIAGAIFGTLLGPVLGTMAVAAGTEIVFSLVGVMSLLLAAWTFRFPEPPTPERGTPTTLRALAANPRILLGAWLILLEAATIGATGTLIPLRLSHFGASGVVIGATFLLASLVSTVLATPIGRLVDRRGAGLPLVVGLTTTAVLLAVLPIPHTAVALALLSVIALGGPLTAYTIPAMSVITESAERAGIAAVVATMLLNLAWATGETVGAPAGATLSQATSDSVPLLLLALIMVVTLVPVLRARLTASSPVEATPDQAPAAARPEAGAEARPEPGAEPEPRPEPEPSAERIRVGTL